MNSHQSEYRKFLKKNIIRAVLYFIGIIGLFIFLNKFFGDEWREWIDPLKAYPKVMFLIFLGSETIVGLLPPEFFMIWAIDENVWRYVLYVAILASLSMLGALINFFLGKLILKSRRFRKYFAKVIRKYSPLYHKWGGVIIIIAALTHLPFAAVSLVSGTMDFPLKKFILFASFRLLRFTIYAYAIWTAHAL